jgi:aldose 1-epimerase
MNVEPLSGAQYELSGAGYAASVASIGASLRALSWEGRDLIVPFEADQVRPVYRGATLAPWPNRVVDGRYSFDGVDYELALTEPARGHALHGLATWLKFEPVTHTESTVSLAATVPAQAGYPFRIELTVEFALADSGLTISTTATNTGASPAPFGTSIHPYLVAGGGCVDDWTLELPAASVLTVTPDRLVPDRLLPVSDADDGRLDFRSPRQIADTEIDHAFTDLQLGPDQTYTARLTDTKGLGVEMVWNTTCPWVQVHTADHSTPELNRVGLALEPMTCPPDAFNSGDDLIVLRPGDSSTTSWRIARL